MTGYKKLVITAVLIALTLFFSGCIDQNEYTKIAVGKPEAQKFFADHPGSRITSILLDSESTGIVINQINQDCGREMPVQDYWYLFMVDGGNKLELYIDIASKETLCVVLVEGGESHTPIVPGPGPKPECTSNSDCLDGKNCCNGTCREPICRDKIQCREGQICADAGTCYSKCTTGCEADNECQGEKLCCSNVCTSPKCNADADCDDNELTTVDTCLQPSTCEASCENVTTGDCVNGDGACPSNCDPGVDTDCFVENRETLRRGESLLGLRGQGDYWENNTLFVKLQWVNQIAPLNFEARLELYRDKSRLIEEKTVREGQKLDEIFLEANPAVLDSIEVGKIAIGPSGKGYVELITNGECEDEDQACYSNCDEGNDLECQMPGKHFLRIDEKIENLRGIESFVGLSNLSVTLVDVNLVMEGRENKALLDFYKGSSFIDSKIVTAPVILNEVFLDSSEKPVFRDIVKVSSIKVGEKSGLGFAEYEVIRVEDGIILENQSLTGLAGAGVYDGQNDLYLKLSSVEIVASYPRADFSLYDGQGTLIGTLTLSRGDILKNEFLEAGQAVLFEDLIVRNLGIGIESGIGFADFG